MDRLDRSKIHAPGLEIRVVERCSSTNAVLLSEKSEQPVLLAAEAQSAGRGRRGRKWRSAPGAGATFSIRRHLRCEQRRLPGLSVAVGISAARARRRLGARGIVVKWPNDLMVSRRKLGGILIETRTQLRSDAGPAADGSTVIVGVGINCRAQPRLGARLARGVAALDEVLSRRISRNAVIGAVAREVLGALDAWERVCEPAREPALDHARKRAA
jgi:BirA family biotin operon repressor/biotin-[acetyl-CoA-carboxylase] ligase